MTEPQKPYLEDVVRASSGAIDPGIFKNTPYRCSNRFGGGTTTLGMPPGQTAPVVLSPDGSPDLGGARLPRPYGPRDNASLLRGFSRRRHRRHHRSHRSHRRSKRSMGRRIRRAVRKSVHRALRRYGIDPTNYDGQEYANQTLAPAKGTLWRPPVITYPDNANYPFNQPMQYSDNAQNIKPLRGFGWSPTSSSIGRIEGPNVVGYETPIPLYHAGGTTVDFATGKEFAAGTGMVGGPTNGAGPWASAGTGGPEVLQVINDGLSPSAPYLSGGPDILAASKLSMNTMTTNGLTPSQRFGTPTTRTTNTQENPATIRNLLQMPQDGIFGTGSTTLYQQAPPTIGNRTAPSGVMVSYGKRSHHPKKAFPTLSTTHKGYRITMTKKGEINVKAK